MSLIGIDARFYGEAGPGRYTKNIVTHLEQVDKLNKYLVFLTKKNFDSYNPKNGNFKKVLADYNWYTLAEQTLFLLTLMRHRLDLFYVPHFNIPVLYPGKMVTAIADVIMHEYSTEAGTTLPKPYYRFKKWIYYMVVRTALKRSKKVIVPTYATMNDLLKFYPKVKKEKYVLAYEALDPDLNVGCANSEEILVKYGITKPYILYISSMYEHKNVKRLVEALELLMQKHGFGGQLVLIGKNDKYSQEIYDLVKARGLESKILMPGMKERIDDKGTVCLRKEASIYVFPSLKEGFTLTPLEAIAHNIPCVISRIPCHEEVYGDSVLFFDAKDVNDIADKMHLVLSDEALRANLVGRGKELLKKYSFTETASITSGVFNDVLKNG